jgi:hypothetical protein
MPKSIINSNLLSKLIQMFNLFIKKEVNKVLSNIIIIIFLFPLLSLILVTSIPPITIIQAETLTNKTYAELASRNVLPSTATTSVDQT